MKNLVIYLIILLINTTVLRAENNHNILAEVIRKEVVTPLRKTTKQEKRKNDRLDKRRLKWKKKEDRKHSKIKLKGGEPKGDGRDYQIISNIFLDVGFVALLIMFAIPIGTYMMDSIFSLMLLTTVVPGMLFIIAMLIAVICLIIGFIKLKRAKMSPKGIDTGLVFGIMSVLLTAGLLFLFLTPLPFLIGVILSGILLGVLCFSIIGIFYNKRQIQKRPNKRSGIETTEMTKDYVSSLLGIENQILLLLVEI